MYRSSPRREGKGCNDVLKEEVARVPDGRGQDRDIKPANEVGDAIEAGVSDNELVPITSIVGGVQSPVVGCVAGTLVESIAVTVTNALVARLKQNGSSLPANRLVETNP